MTHFQITLISSPLHTGLFGAKTWATKKDQERRLEVNEMVTKIDKIRNKLARGSVICVSSSKQDYREKAQVLHMGI